MKLVLLGTGGYYPTNHRHTACIMLPDVGVVLDAGSGMCRIADHLQTDRLDIFLSHAHLDHILGLTCLVNGIPQDVLRKSTLHAEEGKLAAVREHLFAEPIFPVAPPFGFAPLTDPFPLPGGGTLTHFPLKHPGGSRGFRLDWPNRSMAYVTDTTADVAAEYVDNIRGVDLLVHEAYFAIDEQNLPAVTGHSALLPVSHVAAAAQVRRLVLVHIDPQLENLSAFDLTAARDVFPATEFGDDGMELTF